MITKIGKYQIQDGLTTRRYLDNLLEFEVSPNAIDVKTVKISSNY